MNDISFIYNERLGGFPLLLFIVTHDTGTISSFHFSLKFNYYSQKVAKYFLVLV